jgi:putative membrane protein
MMGWYGDGMGGAAPLLWILMGVFWIAVIGLIVFLVSRLLAGSRQAGGPTAPPGRAGETPEQILDRVFAAGEVDEQTYRTRRGALTQMRKPS